MMSLMLESVVVALLSLTPAGATAPEANPAAAPPHPEGPKSQPGTAAKPAMAPDVKALVERMQAFYEKTSDFTAAFKQEYTYKAFKSTHTSTGKVTFKKPALMRWEYEKPSPKTFVLAGEKVYTYDPEAKTLTKGSIASNQLSASVTFLWGRGRLADEFSIARVPCDKCQGSLLELTPLKPDPRFRKVSLEVDSHTAQVLRSVVEDPDGSKNAISFLDLKTNVGVGPNFFKLDVPQDTQVMDLNRPQK